MPSLNSEACVNVDEQSKPYNLRLWLRMIGILLIAILPLWGLAQSKPRTTISFWAVTGDARDQEMYDKIQKDFEASTGIHVDITPLGWGSFDTKFQLAIATGAPPDCGVTNSGGPYKYGTMGGVVDLIGTFGDRAKSVANEFDPRALRQLSEGNKLYGIPYDLSGLMLYYRKDVFEKLNLKEPKTWSELNTVIDKIEANGYTFFPGSTEGAQWTLPQYTQNYGFGGLHVNLQTGATEVDWTNPRYQDAVMQAFRLWFTHDAPGRDAADKVPFMFLFHEKSEVKVAMFMDFAAPVGAMSQKFPEKDDLWSVMAIPHADDGKETYIMGGTAFVIFRDSPRKEEAMQWIEYLNSMDVQKKMILDRMNRGTESSMMISGITAMYEPQNDSFWQLQAFRSPKAHGLLDVVNRVVLNNVTTEAAPAISDVALLESNLIDRMKSFIADKMNDRAKALGLSSRSDYIRKVANGKFPGERDRFEGLMRSEIAKQYTEISPKGNQILAKGKREYEEGYKEIVANLDEYRKKRTFMTPAYIVFGFVALAAVIRINTSPKLRRHRTSYLFISIPVGLAFFFIFLPAVTAFYLSLTNYQPILPLSTAKYIGSENYVDIWTSGDITNGLFRCLTYALLTVPTGIVLSLIFARALNSQPRFERLWRLIFFTPLVTGAVSVSLIFIQLYASDRSGWLNTILLKAHLINQPLDFLNSESLFPKCAAALGVWLGLAFTTLIFYSALKQVPEQLYEAAEIDGASPRRTFWKIAVPSIRPAIFLVSVLGVIGAFQVFETLYLLAGKSDNAAAKFGPNDSMLTIVPMIYHNAFESLHLGRASAMAYVLLAVLLLITLVQFVQYRKNEVNA